MSSPRSFWLVCAVSLLVQSSAQGQELLRLVKERTVSGAIEMSVSKDTPILFISIDLPNEKGSFDGNLEAFYVIELEPGVPKPEAMKGRGTLVYKQHESLQIELNGKKLSLSRLVPHSADPKSGNKRIVDLNESRRSPIADKPILHADMAAIFLPMAHGPFVKRPLD
jgi:hypothetical protein